MSTSGPGLRVSLSTHRRVSLSLLHIPRPSLSLLHIPRPSLLHSPSPSLLHTQTRRLGLLVVRSGNEEEVTTESAAPSGWKWKGPWWWAKIRAEMEQADWANVYGDFWKAIFQIPKKADRNKIIAKVILKLTTLIVGSIAAIALLFCTVFINTGGVYRYNHWVEEGKISGSWAPVKKSAEAQEKARKKAAQIYTAVFKLMKEDLKAKKELEVARAELEQAGSELVKLREELELEKKKKGGWFKR